MNFEKILFAKDLDAICLDADLHAISPFDNIEMSTPDTIIYWRDAPQEMQQDTNIFWWTFTLPDGSQEKYTYKRKSEQEKIIEQEKRKAHLIAMFDYILIKYGTDSAIAFVQSDNWSKRIEEEELDFTDKINNIKYCKYNNGQCNFFCHFFKGGYCNDNDNGI